MARRIRAGVALGALIAVGLPAGTLGTSPAGAVDLSTHPVEVRTTFRPDGVDFARGAALEPDGTVIMAGGAGGDFGLSRSTPYAYNTWGTDGRVTVDFDGRTDVALAVASPGDRGALAAGTSSGDVALFRADDQGYPSPAFGTRGRVLTDLGGADDAAYGVTVLPDGGVLAAGGNATTAALIRYRPDGSLDPAFGTGGIVRSPAPGPWRALTVQPDGKLVVAGGGDGLLVARYLPTGTADPSFGTAGRVLLLLGPGTVAHAVCLWIDGSITVAGGRNGDVAMARMDADGVPLQEFGTGGSLVVDLGRNEAGYGVAVNYEGNVNVVGERGDAGFAASYLPSGAPNPAIGPVGAVFTENYDYTGKLRAIIRRADYGFAVVGTRGPDMVWGTFKIGNGTGSFWPMSALDFKEVAERANRTVRQPDGKFVITGETSGMAGLVRHNPNGSIDISYGHGGRVVSDLISDARAAAIDGSSRTVVAGSYRGKLALLRFRIDGTLDTSFGTGGRAVLAASEDTRYVGALVVLSDAKILALGTASSRDGMGGWAARFNPDGTADPVFGGDGLVAGTYPSAGHRALLQPDGKVLVVSGGSSITRLTPAGTRDAGFGVNGTVTIDTARALQGAALLPDGRILVGDTRFSGGSERPVTRLTPSGEVDPSWTARLDHLPAISAQEIIPLADGRVLAVGHDRAARYLGTGALDRGFGDAGRLVLKDDIRMTTVDAFLDPDGTVTTAGSVDYGNLGYSLIRSRTGSLWLAAPLAWGWNPVGQLGTGGTVDRPSPTTVAGLTRVVSIAAGAYHSVALRADGTVWAWGWNGVGQLGDGTATDRATPVKVTGLDDVQAISAGAAHNLAVRGDGTVWAWGWNATGQLGDGTTTDRHTPVPVTGTGGATAVAAGAMHSLVLAGGQVYAWGWNGVGQLGDGTTIDRHTPVWARTQPYEFQWPIKAIAAGAYHSLAVAEQGFVHAWGWNAVGQLGDGTTLDRHVPAVVPALSGARAVAAGAHSSFAVFGDDTVRAWGWNAAGMLGDGTLTDRHVPVTVPGLTGIRSIAGGSFHTLAVGMDGRVWSWGWNGVGGLGTGTTQSSYRPTLVPRSGVAVAAAGGFHTITA